MVEQGVQPFPKKLDFENGFSLSVRMLLPSHCSPSTYWQKSYFEINSMEEHYRCILKRTHKTQALWQKQPEKVSVLH